ncbi:hypothetical protein [Roseibium sp.]|uniref:hypothetical protein n=1 Tax=Roseibium sp. TaxID=1936156 RepID=UPI003D09D4F5
MLSTAVVVAEVLVAVWFIVFSIMLTSMYLDSRAMKQPNMDIAGRTLIGSARLAFATGLSALAVLTVLEITVL